MPHEFDGKRYAHASAHQKEWGTTLIAELNLEGTERVLDLGCGVALSPPKLRHLSQVDRS
jgi:trans-aconitate methyltransferase